MLSIIHARSGEDFAVAETLCVRLGQWDAEVSPSHGVSAEDVLALFHNDDRQSLATTFGAPDAGFLIAQWQAVPAGSLAYNAFDDEAAELHKFFVDQNFRGRGIGMELLRTALREIGEGRRRRVLVHTTPYMGSAVALYEACGFRPCPRFRDTPAHVAHTDHFMDLQL